MNPLIRHKSDRRRRWFGLLYLLIAGIMLLWGVSWLEPYLVGWKFLVYWLGCFLVTMMAILVALLDMWIIRIRARQQRHAASQGAIKRNDAIQESKDQSQAPDMDGE